MSPPKTNDKALVSIVIGNEYFQQWNTFCHPTWELYAKKHGYDIIILQEPVVPEYVTEEKSIHWQKCFVLDHPDVKKYKTVVWLDTDILINYHRAPCIAAQLTTDKIGAVSLVPQTRRIHENTLARHIPYKSFSLNLLENPQNLSAYQTRFREVKNNHNYEINISDRINTGVLVLSPEKHANFLRNIYFKYENIPNTVDFEQGPLSCEMIDNDMVEYLDPGFNAIYYIESLHHYPFMTSIYLTKNDALIDKMIRLTATSIFINSYFLHFPGPKAHIPYIDHSIKDEFMIPEI